MNFYIVKWELKKNNIVYKAINSCIAFTTSLEGKQLLVVEDLMLENGSLHPVQSAMVNYHGSQCGFCTPGQLMTATALLENNASPDAQTVKEALVGNLCRCSNYNAIVEAVVAAGDQGGVA